MTVTALPKIAKLSQSSDFKKDVVKEIGNLDDLDLYFNEILVATYIRPEKIGNIIRPQSNIREDEYQGKVGLVLKKGPMAFTDDAEFSFEGQDAGIGDYIVYRVGDGWACTINGVPCRVIKDRNVRMRVKNPEMVF